MVGAFFFIERAWCPFFVLFFLCFFTNICMLLFNFKTDGSALEPNAQKVA